MLFICRRRGWSEKRCGTRLSVKARCFCMRSEHELKILDPPCVGIRSIMQPDWKPLTERPRNGWCNNVNEQSVAKLIGE